MLQLKIMKNMKQTNLKIIKKKNSNTFKIQKNIQIFIKYD